VSRQRIDDGMQAGHGAGSESGCAIEKYRWERPARAGIRIVVVQGEAARRCRMRSADFGKFLETRAEQVTKIRGLRRTTGLPSPPVIT